MTVWIIIAVVLLLAFAYRAFRVLIKRSKKKKLKCNIPVMGTSNKRKKFFRRFRYLEGLGD